MASKLSHLPEGSSWILFTERKVIDHENYDRYDREPPTYIHFLKTTAFEDKEKLQKAVDSLVAEGKDFKIIKAEPVSVRTKTEIS